MKPFLKTYTYTATFVNEKLSTSRNGEGNKYGSHVHMNQIKANRKKSLISCSIKMLLLFFLTKPENRLSAVRKLSCGILLSYDD